MINSLFGKTSDRREIDIAVKLAPSPGAYNFNGRTKSCKMILSPKNNYDPEHADSSAEKLKGTKL
jgi:hypothetical protein